jgi:penicillin-binding protein 1C
VHVTFADALEAERDEWFLAGTAMPLVAAKGDAPQRPSIVYPAHGQIIAVDPDIPPAAQRVRFRATGADGRERWRLDGEPVAPDGFWTPQPGQHVLTLHDAQGEELGRVEFQVRGGTGAPQSAPFPARSEGEGWGEGASW